MAREMKNSGISWVGMIPNNWIEHPLGTYFSERIHPNSLNQETNLLSLSYGKIVRKNINSVGGLLPASYAGYNIIEADDIVIRPTDLQNDKKSLRTGLSKEHGIVTSAYITLKPNKDTYSPYFHYLLHSYDIAKAFYNMGNGVRQGMNYSELKKLLLIEPPLDEQRAIAAFLDTKCAEIDGLLTDLDAEVKNLAEYKKSIIAETVTRGLNPSAPMKQSNIPWVGEMPSHWEIDKGKYRFELRRTKGNPRNLELMSPTQKYGVIPQSQLEGVVLVKEKTDLNTFRTIRVGDFCISLRSFQGGFEYSKYEGVVSPAYQVFYPIKPIVDGYFKYMFKSDGFISYINTFSMSLRDGKNIAFEDFGNSNIPIPPIEEQTAIADYLDEKCSAIEQSIEDKNTQIETLKAYKSSLIYEYVTGKKQVAL